MNRTHFHVNASFQGDKVAVATRPDHGQALTVAMDKVSDMIRHNSGLNLTDVHTDYSLTIFTMGTGEAETTVSVWPCGCSLFQG